MKDYDATTYGDEIADYYDDFARDVDPTPLVAYLAGLAGAGPALELGIGTGRVALPLAARGVEVHGVEASARMADKLHAKPGGDAIPVTLGDFAQVAPDGRYPVVFLVFNTLFALTTQDEQVACFANVARHLTSDGVFVLEAFVPDPGRFDRGQRTGTTEVTRDRVQLEVATHDAASQRVEAQQIVLSPAHGVQLYPLRIRYAWPSELDLMARLAGLRLRARYGGWREEPFTAASGFHVSLYEPDPGLSPRTS